MPFDYDSAREDIRDSGADPDYLDTLNPEKRDAYLRSLGMKPETYGGGALDPYYRTRKKQDQSSGTNSEGCFVTSACIRARGLPDDCEELQTLRRFRDEWVANTPEGSGEIREYYRLAPQIVKAVNARPDAPEVWDRIYRELVLECMDLIRKGKSGETYRLYKSYTLSLAEELL